MILPSKLFKPFLLGLLLTILILPAIQTRFPLFKVAELEGYAEYASRPEFNWSKLIDDSYQPALERYVEDSMGLRELFIRSRNQLAYSLFSVSKANGITVGRDDVLFEEQGILSYLGRDFRGEDIVRVNVRKLKAVQDTLARRGILLVFAIAPEKAFFFTDYHPDRFRQQPRLRSNYAAYTQQMQRSGVNLIDLAQVFQQLKDTVSYPLFPRGGIHWSGYGITLAADTLFNYIEQRGGFNLPDYTATSRTVTNKPRSSDEDIARGLNLIRRPAAFQMAYPDIEFKLPKPNEQKPNLLLVGDSFGWGLIGFYPYMSNLFSDKTQFWYYNTQVEAGARDDMPPGREVYLLDQKAEILAQDVILLLYNQRNLSSFDYGFSATAYNLFFPLTTADQARIQVRQSPAAQDTLWKQASTTNRNYNQLLHEMAVAEYELHRP